MADETSAPVPPGWVRLTLIGGGEIVTPIVGLAAWSHEDGSGRSTITGYLDVAESPDEVAALIAEARRAQRRFDAVPGMAATVLCPPKMGLVDPRQRYYEAADDALALLDAIEAREAGR